MSLENLPPEMQARIAAIMAGQPADASPHQASIPQEAISHQPTNFSASVQRGMQQPSAPIQKPPSLMDHVIALRGEVSQLQQQVAAQSQVVEAVGNAVGAIYEMFSPSAQQGYSYEAEAEEYPNQADF